MNLENLNSQQKKAVLSQAPSLLVLAGAGSGKTRVLTDRIAYLVQEKHAPTWAIAAFTFTNKAAQEMKDRVAKALGRPVNGMWIGTFHALCARILRREIQVLGYSSSFTIYDSQDQKALVKKIIKEKRIASQQISPATFLSSISHYKNQGIRPDEARERASHFPEEIFAQVYGLYEKEKKANDALDFDDLILKTLDLFQKEPSVRDKYRSQFSHLFVDEYQDTSHAQYDLILTLTGPETSVFLVGDADQSIYGWRGADISNILNFEKDFTNPEIILLEQNYRSSKSILQAANVLIEKNTERKKKHLWTENPQGPPVRYEQTGSENEEAARVIQLMEEEREKGRAYQDMAILYRTNAQSRPFEEALIRQGISYRVVGGLKFYDRAEIKDLIAYMNLSVNSRDDLSFLRVVNQPKRGIGPKTIEPLARLAAENGLSLLDTLTDPDLCLELPPPLEKKLQPFRVLMEDLASRTEEPLTSFFDTVYEKSGYQAMLENSINLEDQARMENVLSFKEALSQYEEEEDEASLTDYLQNLSLLSDLDKTEEKEKGVLLMTMHSAKGLEFPLVFIVGLEEGLFPSQRSVDEGGLEEERRLMYVAMTRAEEKLFLFSASSRRVYGTLMGQRPSRFLSELEGTIERIEPEEESFPSRKFGEKDTQGGFANPGLKAAYDLQRSKIRRMVQERKKREKQVLSSPFRVGDKVIHRKFGRGTVVSVLPAKDGDELTVAFEKKGIKRLSSTLAPLKKES